jgi:hypothetical protein
MNHAWYMRVIYLNASAVGLLIILTLGIIRMPEAVQMKCNKCAKPTIFEIEQDWDIPSEVVVAKCQRCENKGVREVTDFMKEPVRCTKCGAWKMEGLSCSICAKINVPNA